MANYQAAAILALAKDQLGYCEKASNANLDSKTANAGHNNWTKYAAEIDKSFPNFYNGNKNGYAWCDVFVDWLFIHTYGEEAARYLLCQPVKSLGASCSSSVNYYKQAGRFSTTPEIGAQIFFKSLTTGTVSHTGIVLSFNKTSVTTIEGNKGDKVAQVTYSISNPAIYGYGLPRYTEADKGLTAVAQDVIKGRYGNGAARKANLEAAGYNYTEVQNEVNRLLMGKKE